MQRTGPNNGYANRAVENSNLFLKIAQNTTEMTDQRRDKYFLCMYCIHLISKITFTLTFSEISDLYFFVGRL